MGSIFAHFSIGMLALIFPNTFNFGALVLASLFPDFEYLHLSIINFFRKRKLNLITDANLGMLYFHSLILTLLVSVPLCLFLSINLFDDTFLVLLISVIVGLISHLLLDLPAHFDLMILWPFKKITDNPLLLKAPKAVYTLYDILKLGKFETRKYQHVQTFYWLLLSNIIIILLLAMYIAV